MISSSQMPTGRLEWCLSKQSDPLPVAGTVVINALQESITQSLYLRLAAMLLLVSKQQAGMVIQACGTLLAHVACERP